MRFFIGSRNLALLLVSLGVYAGVGGCAGPSHAPTAVAVRPVGRLQSLFSAGRLDALGAIRHHAVIYVVRVVRRESLPSTVEWTNRGILFVRVEHTIWGPRKRQLQIYFGTRTMSIALPFQPFYEPRSQAMDRGAELLVLLFPKANPRCKPVRYWLGRTRIWVLWGSEDPFTESLKNLAHLIRQSTKAGATPETLIRSACLKMANARVDIWAQCHSNYARITSANEAMNEISAAFNQRPLGFSALGLGVRAAPFLFGLPEIKSATRCGLVAAIAIAACAAPPVDKAPLLRCLGQIVCWDNAYGPSRCLNSRQRSQLQVLLEELIPQASARRNLTRYLNRDMVWLRQ
ncbi:MAG: hypothetical protein HKL95_08240 [Phycisphaerae bacterium]|nr:hypothetical protein [Phycisphaerae bacterium]